MMLTYLDYAHLFFKYSFHLPHILYSMYTNVFSQIKNYTAALIHIYDDIIKKSKKINLTNQCVFSHQSVRFLITYKSNTYELFYWNNFVLATHIWS